jgi:hypothetical protein
MHDGAQGVAEAEQRCGRCGYLLRGLPEEGRCPECGAGYGPDVLVLWGEHGRWAASAYGPSYRWRWERRRWLKVGQQVVWLWAMGMVVVFVVSDKRWPMRAFGAGLLALLAATEWQLLRSWHGWQVRLTAAGYGRRAGDGNVGLRPCGKDLEIDLRRVASDFNVLTIRHLLVVHVTLMMQYPDDAVAQLRERIERLAGQHVGLEK